MTVMGVLSSLQLLRVTALQKGSGLAGIVQEHFRHIWGGVLKDLKYVKHRCRQEATLQNHRNRDKQ